MKKFLLTAAFFLTAVIFTEVKAQTTGSTVLSVKLETAQSIRVNHAAVLLTLNTSDHYTNGVAIDQANHITFASNVGFKISAKGTDLTNGAGEVIEIGNITIKPTQGTTGSTGTLTTTALDADDTIIYSSASAEVGGTNGANLNINYKAAGGTPFLNKTGTFTSNITYTIAPF